MKRISQLGPLKVVHNGQHFEMPRKQPNCHGFSRCCHCDTCKKRAQKQNRVALPWEEDYRDAA